MDARRYQMLALRTMADQGVILERLQRLGPIAMQIDNAARGLCNDAGEVAEGVKNWIEYGKEFDAVNMMEEVGDVLWRVAQMCEALDKYAREVGIPEVMGFDLGMAMTKNIAKLSARYPDKYSDERADPANRDRAAERQAVAEKLPTARPVKSTRERREEKVAIEKAISEREKDIEDGMRKGWGIVYDGGWVLVPPATHPSRFMAARWVVTPFKGLMLRVPSYLPYFSTAPEPDEHSPIYDALAMEKAINKPGTTAPPDAAIVREPEASFGDGLKRDETSSYGRLCTICNRNPVHRNNSACICPDCAALQRAEWKWREAVDGYTAGWEKRVDNPKTPAPGPEQIPQPS